MIRCTRVKGSFCCPPLILATFWAQR